MPQTFPMNWIMIFILTTLMLMYMTNLLFFKKKTMSYQNNNKFTQPFTQMKW